MNQVSSQVILVELVEVDVSEIPIGDFLGKHRINRYQALVCYRQDCPLVSSPGLEAIKFVPQVCSLGLRCRLGGLYQPRVVVPNVRTCLGSFPSFQTTNKQATTVPDAHPTQKRYP